MRVLLFILGLLVLLVPEILRIYYIMPFPGSQVSDTIGMAYFLHRYINLFRLTGWLIIAFPLYSWWTNGKWSSKIISSVFLVLYGVIFYFFNFIAKADHMFLQPTNKVFSSVDANKVAGESLVMGIVINGEARAYPIQVIGYHHQIQDTVGGKPVMMTYCTVCRSGRAYSPFVNGHYEKFRLVGMDHFNAMFEDASTKSWWRQENGEAIAGKQKGNALEAIPAEQMMLSTWIRLHPETKILQPDTTFQGGYDVLEGFDHGTLVGSLEGTNKKSWELKSWVVGIQVGNANRVFDWNDLKVRKVINDTLNHIPILLAIDNDTTSFHAWDRRVNGEPLFFLHDPSSQFIMDSTTHSLWDLSGECIEGSLKGSKLKSIPAYQEFYHSWKQFHPQARE